MKILCNKRRCYGSRNVDDWHETMYDVPKLARIIAQRFNVSYEAAAIVSKWYMEEDALGDFESLEEFLEFFPGDLPDMIDGSLNTKEIKIVGDAFGIDTSFL